MQPNNPYGPTPPPNHQPHDYEFIMNPNQSPKRNLNVLSGGTPLALRIILVAGGLLIILIFFIVLKSLLSGGGNTEALINVAQEQQQLIHLTSNATKQNGLSTANLNFSVTAQTTLSNAQGELLTYIKKNGHKVKPKVLGLKVSSNVDQQLQTAATNSTYNDTYKDTMQSELKDYQQVLRTAYQQTAGPKGRKLLSDQYKDSQLLLQQLDNPTT